MAEKRKEMIEQIRQFSVFKEIMDRNCQHLAISSESLVNLGIDQKFHIQLMS